MKLVSVAMFLLGAFSLPSLCMAATIHETVYLNRGEFIAVTGARFPYLALNFTPNFSVEPSTIAVTPGDTLELTFVNNDSVVHTIIDAVAGGSVTVSPDGQRTHKLYSAQERIQILTGDSEEEIALGLSMVVVFGGSADASFYWNIRSHQSSLNHALAQGARFDRSAFNPDYFTINGLSFPEVQADPRSTVVTNVGDTVLIAISNTGFSTHSIHFHGFHCKVRFTTSPFLRVGWSKDTFPVKPGEALLLELVPDKPGRYSVHDHNLIALSGGGRHPNGMFTIMEIDD